MAAPSTDKLDLHEAPPWDWILGDGAFNCEILDGERLSLPPFMEVQWRLPNWAQTLHSAIIDHLCGRSLIEVAHKVARIKFGSTFLCFEGFDRCLDSWCVLNGRSSHRLANKFGFHLRVCHYGPIVRPQWQNLHVGPNSRPIPPKNNDGNAKLLGNVVGNEGVNLVGDDPHQAFYDNPCET